MSPGDKDILSGVSWQDVFFGGGFRTMTISLFLPAAGRRVPINDLSLRAFRAAFAHLHSPSLESLVGDYRAEFVGPGWLRRWAPPGLVITPLAGWLGKSFDSQGHGINLVQRRGVVQRVLPMAAQWLPSRVDGRRGVTLTYAPGSAFPFAYVVDELRTIDADTLLGLSFGAAPWLARLPMPFLLRRQAKLSAFFGHSPLAGADLDLTRDMSLPRDEGAL